jgi:hypothetical protein
MQTLKSCLHNLLYSLILEKHLKNEIEPKPFLIIHDYENNNPYEKSTNKI